MKQRGDAWEREVVRVLRKAGLPADRAYGAGRPDDVGDIDGVVGYAIECKAQPGRLQLATWMGEAEREAAGRAIPVVVAKRKGKPAEDGWVVMRLEDWAECVAGGEVVR